MSENNEVEHIYSEIERRKKRADELVVRLFHDKIKLTKRYEKYRKNPAHHKYIYSSLSEAKQVEEGVFEVPIKGRVYAFAFKEKSLITGPYGTLTITVDSKKVFELEMAFEVEELPEPVGAWGEWKPSEVTAFIESNWCTELKELSEQISQENADRERRDKESPDKLRKLKEDFGIG